MNELLGKLTNFGYELTGIILPGIVVILFLLLWWTALGPLVLTWTYGNIPEFSVDTARGMIESLSAATGVGVAIPAVAACYFAGHLLHWVARSGNTGQDALEKKYKRVWCCLRFSIPKPTASYNPALQNLFYIVQQKFAKEGTTLEWREFYPVAKTFLAQRVANSLVSTYQNKYTFHRSITIAAALLFWASVLGIIAAYFTPYAPGQGPSYFLLVFLALSALALVNGFSASYVYNWEMFGNTIITETYSKLCGPPDEQSKR